MENSYKSIHGDSLWYATKVWLTGALIPPVATGIFLFGFTQASHDQSVALLVLFVMAFLGCIFAIPIWIVFHLTTQLVWRQSWSTLKQKLVLGVVAALLTFMPFLAMAGFEIWGDEMLLVLGLAYVLSVCLAVFIYSFDEYKV